VHTIQLTYRNIFNRTRTVKATVPGTWDEFTPKQFLAYFKIVALGYNSNSTLNELYYHICGIKNAGWRQSTIHIRNTVLDLLSFVNETPVMQQWKVMPWYRAFFGRTPGNMLCKLTMGEYAALENKYIDYIREKNPENLNICIAALYRMSVNNVGYMAEVVKQASLFNYVACRNQIIDNNTGVYPPTLENDSAPSTPPSELENINWLRIIDACAGPELGSIDQIFDKPCNNIIAILNDRAQRKPASTTTNENELQ